MVKKLLPNLSLSDNISLKGKIIYSFLLFRKKKAAGSEFIKKGNKRYNL